MISFVYLILVLSALLYTPWFPAEEFETPKTLLMISFACFALGLATYKYVLRDKIAQALLLFLLSCGISTALSSDFYTSIFGNPKMPNGLILWISYFIYYLVASKALRPDENKERAINIISATSFIVAVYAIMQALGYDLKVWYGLPAEHGYTRPPSLLGHPNFMAAYLVCALPFTEFLLFNRSKNKILKVVYLTIILSCLGAIIASQSRGMWLALLGSQVALFALAKTKIKEALVILGCLIIASLAILSSSTELRETFIERGSQLVSLGGPRQEYLKGAFNIWKKNPIFGSGTDNFELPFRQVRTSFYWKIERNGSPHRAHNEFLNVLATQGLFGFLCFIVFFIIIIKNLYRFNITMAITAGFIIQELSSFHCVATVVLLLTALAISKPKTI